MAPLIVITVQWSSSNSLSIAVYVSEQVCIRWRRTGAYYTATLTFSYNFPFKVWGAYYTNVHIMFKFLHYIFACHTSSSCIVCFVVSLTKIQLNSIKNLHFTGTEPYNNYITTSAASVKPRPPQRLSQWARPTCQHCWHNPMLRCDIGLYQCKQSRPVEYLRVCYQMVICYAISPK